MQAVLVLASRDDNGDGHEPRDGNRDCDPKYRVFQHRCEDRCSATRERPNLGLTPLGLA
jgi:hypothetical protein